jgi:hypothetical protein
MTIDELTKSVSDGNKITWKDAKSLLEGHEYINAASQDGSLCFNFDNCNLSVNGINTNTGSTTIPDDAVLYNPLI